MPRGDGAGPPWALGERFRYRQGCRQDEGYKTRGRPRWGLCLPQLRRKNTPSGRHTLLWDKLPEMRDEDGQRIRNII